MSGCGLLVLAIAAQLTVAQPLVSQTITGTVRDSDGGVLPGAVVELIRAADRRLVISAVTGGSGMFTLVSIPPGRYHVRVMFSGFEPSDRPIVVGPAPLHSLDVVLALSRINEEVSVPGSASLAELAPTARTTVDRSLIETLTSESVSSGLSSLVTLTAPGVAADSNGVFHPLGEHAETSFVIDNQPVSDQQSRIFSNQLSPNAIQSVDITTGVPAAEFGDKTSLVANVITRSGLAARRPHGSALVGLGSFRTPTASLSVGRGTDRVGNFFTIDGTASHRFLDTPEIEALHANGHVLNLFDRFDLRLSSATGIQTNVIAAQAAFETPNTYDQEAAGQDQGQHQRTVNVASSVNHVFGTRAVLDVNAWFRRDGVVYDGSANVFADQPAALGQHRDLTNAGSKVTASFVAGRHTMKVGLQHTTTWLSEQFQTGITDATFNSPCFTREGDPSAEPSLRAPAACDSFGLIANPDFLPALLPYDLTRGGLLFSFDGSARVQQWAAYVQDVARLGHWTATAGVRVERYDGLSHATGVQPRLGLTYRVERTRTVWRVAYGRIFPTPYNENLVLASSTGAGGFGGGLLGSIGGAPLTPARRNQFDVGVQQELAHAVKIDADYFWKFTDGPYDFNVVLNTPLTFPVQFRKSQIEGGLVRVTLAAIGGVQVYTTLSHTRSRLFGPSVGGLRFSADYPLVARPDHDEPFQSTTHAEYRRPTLAGFWAGLTWRYDSGLVAVSVPTFADALRLTGDEQAAIGLYCGSARATVSQAIRFCDAPSFGATRIRIPPAGTENDDTNPPRIAAHQLFDLGVGFDALRVHGLQLRARVTVANLFDTVALYNFLSTFAGTHFVTPRAIAADLMLAF